MVATGYWNIKGLNFFIKQKELGRWINKSKLFVCGVLKTKIKRENLKCALNKIGGG